MDSEPKAKSSPDSRAKAEARFEELGRRVDQEMEELIRWLNDDVVVAVRGRSSRALRMAAERLARLADQIDDLKRER
jgi:CO dehydrogenase nickel-insertion accessory protein CooC1